MKKINIRGVNNIEQEVYRSKNYLQHFLTIQLNSKIFDALFKTISKPHIFQCVIVLEIY